MKQFIMLALVFLLMSCNPSYQPISEVYDLPPDGENGACYTKVNIPNDDETSTLDWVQVVCPDDRSFKIMNTINNGLKEKGYTVGKVIKSHNAYFIDEISLQALKKFQKDNKLPYGQFDVETLKKFNIKYRNGTWVFS